MPNYLADIIQKVFDGTNAIRTTATINAADIEIGAVEIKNATDDTRAVVGTDGSLQATLKGNVTISDSKGFIGLVTIGNTPNVAVSGNITLSDSKGYIGLVTIGHTPNVAVVGNVTLTDSKTYVGLMTVTNDAYSFNNYASDGTILIKSGAGKLHTLTINTKSIGGPCVLYDSLLPSGTKIASVDTTLSQETLFYDINFTTGLTLDTSAVSTAPDLTVSYK